MSAQLADSGVRECLAQARKRLDEGQLVWCGTWLGTARQRANELGSKERASAIEAIDALEDEALDREVELRQAAGGVDG